MARVRKVTHKLYLEYSNDSSWPLQGKTKLARGRKVTQNLCSTLTIPIDLHRTKRGWPEAGKWRETSLPRGLPASYLVRRREIAINWIYTERKREYVFYTKLHVQMSIATVRDHKTAFSIFLIPLPFSLYTTFNLASMQKICNFNC